MNGSTSSSQTRGGFYIRRPRQGDAIGSALRAAYDPACSVPDEMKQLLAAIDQQGRERL